MLRSDLPLTRLNELPGGPDTVVLCHSARLATDLRRAHGLYQSAHGMTSWQALQTATPALWLDHLCSGALLRGEIPPENVPGILLTKLQERSLWEKAIRADARNSSWAAELFDINGLAQAAMDAGALMQTWRLELPEALQTEECRAFLRWRDAVVDACLKNGWCSKVQALKWQTDCIARGVSGLPLRIGLAGFLTTDPALSRLLMALETRGVELFRFDFSKDKIATVAYREQADTKAECVAAAKWAAELVGNAKNDSSVKSPVRVRIAVADLPARRRTLELALADALNPERIGAAWAGHEVDYQILGSDTLVEQSLVDVGLRLLHMVMNPRRISQAEFGALLCACGWSSDINEADGRASLEARLREMLPPETSLDRLHRAIARVQVEFGIPVLLVHLDYMLETTRQMRAGLKRQLPSIWAGHFITLLEAIGWPGERQLIFTEQAAVKALRDALTSLSTLDVLLGRVDATEALRQLQRHCRDQIFPAPRQAPASVEVCSLADAVAAPVDALWVMGLNEAAWPPATRPNPLLPAELQRRAGIPAAKAEIQTAIAREIQSFWQMSADHVVFSWAAREGERELRVSPLLAAFARVSQTDADPPNSSTNRDHGRATAREATNCNDLLERVSDARAPALSGTERVRGGTRLLQAQAICPAWGFYQFRLGGGVLPAPTGGLDAMARGTLLHGALEVFWRDRSQTELLAMDEPTFSAQVSFAVEQALAEFDRRAVEPIPPRLRQLEHSRLLALISKWLQFEAQRTPFRVIACEDAHELMLEGLRVRVVVDRVDQLEDGRLVIIDYKSGRKISANSWAKSRISEPQLPIYAALAFPEQAVAGVVLARVTMDAPAFIGVAEDEELLPQVKSLEGLRKLYPEYEFADWSGLRRLWAERLHVVAAEVKDGCAAVVFGNESEVKYCDVLPLLRIAERRAQFEEQGLK
ncbi:MAG: PD-(D/E)XK nuclease family protein [Rhodocyclaceae bacterium]|nr:PD-(D/E)XK nuclease family protein [Rhodocyclaceae bacterium]